MISTPHVFRTMSLFLFDTCSHKCSYCHFAETGKVLDAGQLAPYRSLAFIKRVTDFFIRRSTGYKKWLFVMTGGEPLLMPNLQAFCEPLIANGDKISLNTALLVGENTPAFRYLLSAASGTEYMFASLHPESEIDEDEFFRKIKMLKHAGHRVILRYICHPKRLDNLQHVQERCRELDVCFSPSAMISPIYPQAYTAEERVRIEGYFSSLGQILQMEGGVDTKLTKCWAGSLLYHADVRTGVITPCATVSGPILGNIYEDRLDEYHAPIACPSAGKTGCSCNVYFQEDIIIGAEDSKYFAAQKKGFVEPIPADQLRREVLLGNRFGNQYLNMGQVKTSSELILSKRTVKDTFIKNKAYFEGPYATAFHPEFRSWMDKTAGSMQTATERAAVAQ